MTDILSFIFHAYAELNNEEARELTKGKPERVGEAEKYRGTVLKLNNNMLKDVSKLPAALEPVLFNPMELTWIDLSCNELTVISEVNISVILRQLTGIARMLDEWGFKSHGSRQRRDTVR